MIFHSHFIFTGVADSYRSKKYEDAFRRSIEDPESFWAEVAKNVDWFTPWETVLDNTNEPFTKW